MKHYIKLYFICTGEVGDHKNFLDSDFDSAFDAWMKQSCLNLKREIPNFKFSPPKDEEIVQPSLITENRTEMISN